MKSWEQHGHGWRQARDDAETVDCPECHAAIGEHCTNLDGGGELGRLPAHWRRIRASEDT